ncbi:MBL fold metallo-hydrolase [Glutamicibacter sp. PS]|uniref:MBL fold metallo-hydrolase n=1 Tax=Glutamicibacter sp. PS TaxID=3075634 RepID=UPI0028410D97|nr:MBL fold metallo-hydrolase [Glutamicibacter sp. PS]MDR4534535.1 MBL fold metallo-hydrolase [Glutamicibacter sp. PS]
MLLERFYDEDLAQASYLIGCQVRGEAIVVDPRRDIADYLTLAAKHSMRIVAVTETHIHADYLSGTRELAAATGAQIYVSAEGGDDWQYSFDAQRLKDRDIIELGNIRIEARHTPGHTPEHLSFLVTDGAFSDRPGYLLSGDFVFAGDLGRPDLLDEAAGGVDTRYVGARQLFASLKDVLLELDDHVQIFPGHGSGSACGKALGAVPSSTVGYERNNAWWGSYLRNDDIEGFSSELLEGQPEAHAYFARMKRQNREGAQILGPQPPMRELTSSEVLERTARSAAVVIDTREHQLVSRATVSGALAIPGPSRMANFAAWAIDPEYDQRELIVLAADAPSAEEMRDHLIRVGIDTATGFITSLAQLPEYVPNTVRPAQLAESQYSLLLDVRTKGEYARGHIPGARQLSAGRLLAQLSDLPREGTIVTYCQSGMRNSVASSVLRQAGYRVVQLDGSYAAWCRDNATAKA